MLRCTGWWHAVPQPGLVARTLEFPSLEGDGETKGNHSRKRNRHLTGKKREFATGLDLKGIYHISRKK